MSTKLHAMDHWVFLGVVAATIVGVVKMIGKAMVVVVVTGNGVNMVLLRLSGWWLLSSWIRPRHL